jgi:hypothetical protein
LKYQLQNINHIKSCRDISLNQTNLSASEIENAYGNRVRSRMRELFNLIAFDAVVSDKRK